MEKNLILKILSMQLKDIGGADLKINILIDGTLKNFEKPFERASYLKEKNYICEIRAVVTKPEKSALANLLRYEDFIQKEFERKWTKEEYSKFLSDADHLIKKNVFKESGRHRN